MSGVVLRRFVAADLNAFVAYRNDPEVARFQSWESMDAARAAGFLAAMAEVEMFKPGAWSQIAISEPGGKLLGDMGVFLSQDAGEVELGITLARAAQGKGHASAAMQQAVRRVWADTQADRVLGICDARNIRSIRMLTRVGFVERWRETITEDGEEIEEIFHVIERP